MNKLTSIRIKQEDGTYSEEYPVSVLAENVVWKQGQSNSLVDILGQVSFNTNGSIQHQIDVLDNKKFNTSDLNAYLVSQISTDVANWLNTNVNPVGSAVTVDESLRISGSAADSKVVGDNITDLENALDAEISARTTIDSALQSHKVNIPLDDDNQPTNGTNGQTLRTKGNGTTEWADVGLPTDEQTADAVSAWLDNHPEATTTVLDGSLTDSKFSNTLKRQLVYNFDTCADMKASTILKTGMVCQTAGYYSIKDGGAALYYIMNAAPADDYYETLQGGLVGILVVNYTVTPKMFGAKGDGETDDTTAIKSAIDSGIPVDLHGKTYKITNAITVSNNEVRNGIIKLASNARINGSRMKFSNVTFDASEETIVTQKILSLTALDSNAEIAEEVNVIEKCYFGKMEADNFAYQLEAVGCNIVINGCTFDVVRINHVNGSQGDNIGAGRHILAKRCIAKIANNHFCGFDGSDTNYLEDSDCIHTSNCVPAIISNNSFSGFWKSAIKNQFGNVSIIGNIFNCTAGWYVIRSHEDAENTLIADNTITGKVDICFYFQSKIIHVVGNTVNLECVKFVSVTQLTDNSYAKTEFNGNRIHLTFHAGVHATYTNTDAVVFSQVGGEIVSDSVIDADVHWPYNFPNGYDITCHLTGAIETQSTGWNNLYSCSGEIYDPVGYTYNHCTNLIVNAGNARPSFNYCNGIYCKFTANDGITIRNSQNVHVNAYMTSARPAATLSTSTNVVIEIYGTTVNGKIVRVDDDTCTGVAVNYVNAYSGIYNPNDVTLAYKAKSMLT